MKIPTIFIFAAFLASVCIGCERTETAVDLYKKVKEDARQKAQQAQDEAQKIVKEKAKGALSPEETDEEKGDDREKE
jgi:hypothetical protein